jgi:hypothetical protein
VARGRVLDVRLHGFPEATAALRALPGGEVRKALGAGLRAGMGVVRIRAKALAPRRTFRLAQGVWTIRRSKRRSLFAYRLAVPVRAALGIRPAAPGFYPYAQEFGWKPYGGAPQQGPLPFVPGGRGRRSAVARGGMTARSARATLNAHVRKVPGQRFMRNALFGQKSMVLDAVAREVMARVERITPAAAARRAVEFTGQEMTT